MDGLAGLRAAINSVPVPGAPPRWSKEGAAVGLSFLDMALRQNHVRRLTERLRLIEHRAAHCTIEVDVSLGLLDDDQREAGLLYRRLRNRTNQETAEAEKDIIWVPVSRLSRRIHSPVDVRNEAGVKLPRLTEYETSRLLASALYRLLRAILSAHEDANRSVTDQPVNLHAFLHYDHEPRWLIQTALLTLLTERSKPDGMPEVAPGAPGRASEAEAGHRQVALAVLDRYGEALHDYAELLNIAVNDYLLVVALDNRHDEHLMVFDSPLHVKPPPASPWGHRQIRLAGGAYWVQYTTRLPATMRAYHLAAETEPGLRIHTMYLTSDADHALVKSLRGDLVTLGQQLRPGRDEPAGARDRRIHRSDQRTLDLELHTCLGQLAELVRRRRWEASQARIPFPEEEVPAANELARATTTGSVTAAEMDDLETDSLQDSRPAGITADRLAAAASELAEQELHRDFDLENDPSSDRAHAYWRRDLSSTGVDQSIKVTASMFIRDTTEARGTAVVLYAVAVVAISWLVGALLFADWVPQYGPEPLPGGWDGDAVIAVLLLVPGFLYTRLNLPPRHTIAGRLRLVPRLAAYVTIGCAVLLAGVIAATEDPVLIRGAVAVSTVVPLAAVTAMLLLFNAVRDELFLTVDTAPRWVSAGMRERVRRSQNGRRTLPIWATSRRLRKAYKNPDVEFRTSGVDS